MESWADIVDAESNAASKPQTEPIVSDFNEFQKMIDLFGNILALRKSLENVRGAIEDAGSEEELGDLGEEENSLSEMLDFANWQFGHLVGYAALAEMRKFWGVQISMHNVLQERYYKMQKARYEHCKRVVNRFKPEDNEYIAHYKALNEQHQEMRWTATDARELFSDIIEAAFPDAPFDLGWDEHWVEA